MTKKEISKYFSKLGKIGGKNRMASLTPEERKQLSKKAAQQSLINRGKLSPSTELDR